MTSDFLPPYRRPNLGCLVSYSAGISCQEPAGFSELSPIEVWIILPKYSLQSWYDMSDNGHFRSISNIKLAVFLLGFYRFCDCCIVPASEHGPLLSCVLIRHYLESPLFPPLNEGYFPSQGIQQVILALVVWLRREGFRHSR